MKSVGARVAGAGFLLALSAGAASAQQAVTLPAADTPLRERMTNVWAVGTDEGRDWEMFAGVRSVAFDRQDNLYVLDQQNSRVVMFDATGKYVRQFGKKGQGPGEFGFPMQITATNDGHVVVSDLGNRAFIVFKPTGEYVRNIPFGDDVGLMAFGGLYADPRGGVVGRGNSRITPDNPDQENVTTIFRQPLAERSTPTTLFRLTLPKPTITNQPAAGGAQRMMVRSMDPIFGARTAFGVLPDGGLALHHETAYNIKVTDPNGRVLRTLKRALQPRRVTQRDKDAWEQRRKEAEASGNSTATVFSMSSSPGGGTTVSAGAAGAARGVAGGGTAGMRLDPSQMQWSDFMSVVTSIRTDPRGLIWVQRRHQDGRDQGPIDLLKPDGRYLGTLPAQPLPDAVSASGLAAFIVRDDLGIERVAVRRLPATWR